jgi:CDP-diacylglycerol--glycerol-3-phosphate 3-phosphatidyltransferase
MPRTQGAVSKEHQRLVVWNVPNLLTFFRILIIPFVVGFLFFPSPLASFLAAVFFVAASVTDILDGYVARQLKSETAIGQLLDPLADKLLINSAMIMLVSLGRIPAWMVVLIVAREVAVTGLRGIASAGGLVIAASSFGKTKTVFQSFAIGALILHYPYWIFNFHLIGMILLWIALVFTLWSGVDYFNKFWREHLKNLTNVR